MKSRLSSLALHPTRWLVASLVAAGVILIALGASLIAPVVGGALVALSVGGMAYLVTRSLQATNRDLQQQLAERTDALNQALVQLQTEANRNRNLLEAIGAIIHSIADSVIVVDRAGAILIANPAAQRLIAPSASEVIGAPLAVWLRDACIAEEREHVTRSIQLQVQRSGLKVQWAGQRTLSLSLAPVQLQPERQALGMVIVCRDVTREAELDRLKSHFISMVSHELRTPLIGILSQIEVLTLSQSEALSDRQRAATQRITVNAQHLLRLITDLLDHAQVEAGQVLTLQPVAFSPEQLVADLHATLTAERGSERADAHDRSASRRAAVLDRRSGTLAANPVQPGRQRHQVHRARHVCCTDRATGRRALAAASDRYRTRHRAGRSSPPVRAVLSGRATGRCRVGTLDRQPSRRR